MFIVNTFFFLYLSLHQNHQRKFLVCENQLGNKSDSDMKAAQWRMIKLFNLAALLDFPNVIKPNESNPDSETSHFVSFPMEVNGKKYFFLCPMASHDDVFQLFGHYENWLQYSLLALPGGFVVIKKKRFLQRCLSKGDL